MSYLNIKCFLFQEDFDEFSDVDELYNTLPLDKVEILEDLVAIGPPGLAKVTYFCYFLFPFIILYYVRRWVYFLGLRCDGCSSSFP